MTHAKKLVLAFKNAVLAYKNAVLALVLAAFISTSVMGMAWYYGTPSVGGGTPAYVTVCAASGPMAIVCGGLGLVLYETQQKKPFGKNGAVAQGAREARNWVGYRTGLQKPIGKLGKALGL